MRVRFYAVGREITGTAALDVEATSMRELRDALVKRFDARMTRLLDIATLLHEGTRRAMDDDVTFGPEDTIDVLPPFAGG